MTYRELYENALDDLEHNKITLGEFDERVKSLNQEPTSIIEELEKLKAEFDEEFEIKKKQHYSMDFLTGICDCLILIENRIYELKGD